MSTNKTPNYQLHSWLGTDDFRFHEVNENFTALDQHLGRVDADAGRVLVGSYTGPGNKETLQIELGVPPKAVFVIRSDGVVANANFETFMAFALPGQTDNALRLNATGFTIGTASLSVLASPKFKYCYMALW